MTNTVVHLALFKEDQIDHAAEAVSRLRKLGIGDHDISIISGVPYSERILGRPMRWTRVPIIGMIGALAGFLAAVALGVGSVYQYPLRVGGMPFYPIPTSLVVIFELTMLGLLISTFLGVIVETISPSYGPQGYHPNITDGQIGVLFACLPEQDESIHSALKDLDAELKHHPEDKKLWL